MAYNNVFPASYQPMYYAPQQQQNYVPQQQQAGAQNGIIWVQGEAGAKSYLVAPNNTVQLWDSENQVIYLKSADASGMPSMKVLDYTIRDAQNAQNGVLSSKVDTSTDYALKSDLGAIWREIKALQKKLEEEVADE